MIENRRGLTIFSHTMLILGIAVILFPLYVAFVAATLDNKSVFETPMTLIPGGHLLENMKTIWVNGVGVNSAPFWLMMLNSFIMAFAITVGKIVVSMLSAFAIVWFRFPLRNLFFWMIFITLMLPVEVRIFPTVEVIANLNMLDSYQGDRFQDLPEHGLPDLHRSRYHPVPTGIRNRIRRDQEHTLVHARQI